MYEELISIENLLLAWREFARGKRGKKDVQEFGRDLMHHVLALHKDLKHNDYRHGGYRAFKISDPKPRDIHKASVRDRLLHHALYRKLYPFFDRTFIADSYSCRERKGVHKALNRFRTFAYRVSKNDTKTCWVLKCDIRKFFASIDQEILTQILGAYIPDEHILALIGGIVSSFHSTEEGKGLPLGNLTSQLFVNIYMNEFDQFVKHRLQTQFYIRYADDFIVLDTDRKYLASLIPRIASFLDSRLGLSLHPNKVSIKTLDSGIDFLGWVHFPDHRVLRTVAKRRMLRRIGETDARQETVASYLGLLSHGNTHKLAEHIFETHTL